MWELIAEKSYSHSHDDMMQDNFYQVVIEVDTSTGMLRLRDITKQTGPYLRGGKNEHEMSYDVGSLSKPNLGMIRDLASKSSNMYSRDWTGWNRTRGSAKDIIALWVQTNGNVSISESEMKKQIVDKLDNLGADELMKIRKLLRLSSDAVLDSVVEVVKTNSFMSLRRPLEGLNLGRVTMDDSGDHMMWMLKTHSGKTVAIVSKNGATPDRNDIVVGNFVVGYL
jgi:hypothetical protein